MIADFHVHSYFSGDSEESPVNIIERAILLGMKSICFTDHQDFDYNYGGFDFMLDDGKYFAEIGRLKEEYRDRIEVLTGVETGVEPHLGERLREFTKRRNYDFIIGSTHLINGVDPWYPEYFDEYGDTEGFRIYFENTLKSLDTCSDFDVYGHLDYIVRYAPDGDKNYSYAKFKDVTDKILIKLISMGKGIELNMGGMYKGMSTPNPNPEILKAYRNFGGEIITVGADAHTADKIGYKFDYARELLQEAGFSYYTVFRQRKPEFIKL